MIDSEWPQHAAGSVPESDSGITSPVMYTWYMPSSPTSAPINAALVKGQDTEISSFWLLLSVSAEGRYADYREATAKGRIHSISPCVERKPRQYVDLP